MNIKTGSYLPFNMIALGVLLMVSSPFVFQIRPAIAIVFLFTGVVLSTTHRRLKVDFKKNYYHEFVWVLAYKSGEKKSFEVIECIYITSTKLTQQFGLATGTPHRSKRYNAYIRFAKSNKAFIAESLSKHALMNRINKTGLLPDVVIEDYS